MAIKRLLVQIVFFDEIVVIHKAADKMEYLSLLQA